MTQTRERDPTDLRALEEQEKEQEQAELVAAILRAQDFAWLLSTEQGRRTVRRQLALSGFDVHSDSIRTTFDRHHGEMCFNESNRLRGLHIIWPMMRALAEGELPFESFVRLMTETDT